MDPSGVLRRAAGTPRPGLVVISTGQMQAAINDPAVVVVHARSRVAWWS